MNLYDIVRAFVDGSGHLLNDGRWRAHAHAAIDAAASANPLEDVASPLPPEPVVVNANITPDLQTVIGNIVADRVAAVLAAHAASASSPVEAAAAETPAEDPRDAEIAALKAQLAAQSEGSPG